jgi:hypothetical protein
MSCAAASCHGGLGQPGSKGSEYTTWALLDPHRRAYAVLLEERSVQMAKLLGLPEPAHRSKVCLTCHVGTSELPESFSASPHDRLGVSCEACHGPAGKWLGEHTTGAWQSLDRTDVVVRDWKSDAGLRDLTTTAKTAGLCVRCHVGEAGREVNHDLIAAGHPRLNFEYSSYMRLYPKHWSTPHSVEQATTKDAREWMVGQMVSARQSLDLLDHRLSRPGAPNPELSEFDCYACHHDLHGGQGSAQAGPGLAWRQSEGFSGKHPGGLVWGTWHTSLLPIVTLKDGRPDEELTTALRALEESLEDPAVSDETRQAALQRAREAISQRLAVIEAMPISADELTARLVWLTGPSADSIRDWDRATQSVLAVRSVHQTLGAINPQLRSPAADATIRELIHSLRFESQDAVLFDSPRQFSPVEFRAGLKRLSPNAMPMPETAPVGAADAAGPLLR